MNGHNARTPAPWGQGAASDRAGPPLPELRVHVPHDSGAALVEGDEVAAAGMELCDVEAEIARQAGDVVLWLGQGGADLAHGGQVPEANLVVTGGGGQRLAMRVERDRVDDGGMLFLAADSASWLTGVTLDVAGGYVMT
jgi:hypothetical protein